MEVRKYPLLLLKILLASSYLVAKSCPTLCDPVDYSLPGTSVHGIFQQESWSGFPFLSPFLTSFIALAPIFKSLIHSELQKLLPPYQQFHLPRFQLFEVNWGLEGEGSGTPLQYSCLENPMVGGAW